VARKTAKPITLLSSQNRAPALKTVARNNARKKLKRERKSPLISLKSPIHQRKEKPAEGTGKEDTDVIRLAIAKHDPGKTLIKKDGNEITQLARQREAMKNIRRRDNKLIETKLAQTSGAKTRKRKLDV